MRTTISLDENVLEAVKRRAAQEGRSVSAYIGRVLDEAVKKQETRDDDLPFRLITAGGGGPFEGVNLDRPRELMVAEDERRYGK
jgi:hypothetical protein